MSNFVTLESEQNYTKINNLYNVWIFIWLAWIVFHFTIVFFFWLVLESILLIGIFLWIGNLVALVLDVPIGVLQKFIKPKHFLMIGILLMVLVSMIFIKFIFFYWHITNINSSTWIVEWAVFLVKTFLSNSVDIWLLLLAAAFYGAIKEVLDVTIISYIFNNSTPSEYAKILSKYNIYNGGGAMVGLIFSGILLAMNMKIAIFIFLFILLGFFIFILKYFDNAENTLEFKDIKSIKLDVFKGDLLNKAQESVGKINTRSLIELTKKSKVILIKPISVKKINFKEVYHESYHEFQVLYKTILGIPINRIILWFLGLIMLYSFWDAFVATFLVKFFEKLISLNQGEFLIEQTKWLITWYVLLWLLVIPAFWFQQFFIDKAKKFWVFKVIMFGNILSALSLICFWFADSLMFVMLFGILNSIGYAATMPLAQGTFSGLYNEEYAKKQNLKEIDSTVSAAPLKVIINTTNVLGIICGAFIVNFLWFNAFFVIFGLGILVYAIYSYVTMRTILIEFNKTTQENAIQDADFV